METSGCRSDHRPHGTIVAGTLALEAHNDGIGQRSECTVRLPISMKFPALSKPTVSMPQPTMGRRILVVDDNRDSAATLGMLLKLTGIETCTGHEGVESVEKAAEFTARRDLARHRPAKSNGYDACRRVLEASWGNSMKAVALNGFEREETGESQKTPVSRVISSNPRPCCVNNAARRTRWHSRLTEFVRCPSAEGPLYPVFSALVHDSTLRRAT